MIERRVVKISNHWIHFFGPSMFKGLAAIQKREKIAH
jgi:hypothetical protein